VICVWDVGANVGFYTTRFAEKVGQGAVVAFEPAGSCYGRRQRIVSWLHERHPIVRSQCSFYWGHLAPTPASPDQLLQSPQDRR